MVFGIFLLSRLFREFMNKDFFFFFSFILSGLITKIYQPPSKTEKKIFLIHQQSNENIKTVISLSLRQSGGKKGTNM